jgi:transposase
MSTWISKLKVSVALVETDRDGEVRFLSDIDSAQEPAERLVAKFGKQNRRLVFCYETGPTGYGPYRQLPAPGCDCIVVAPSLIPNRPGDRVKTNRRNAACSPAPASFTAPQQLAWISTERN